MPSYAQLESEPYWRREIVTDELDWLGDELCRRASRPRDAFGSKGNNSHLNGGHRSQEWIKNSDWCTNTSYTVQSGLSDLQARHIAACDFTPGAWGTSANRALMVAQTKRLWDAARRGELAGLRQIFGTLDGRNAIGLNVLSGSTTVPDSSHVDHWHLTFDRKALRDIALMRRIADTALIGDDDMSWTDTLVLPTAEFPELGGQTSEKAGFVLTWMAARVRRNEVQMAGVIATLKNIAERVGTDPEELAQITAAAEEGAQAGVLAAAQQLAAAVASELADEFGLTPEQAEAAAERAVRKVLGAVDGATPKV